jgi:hypothetical protein
MRVMLIGNLRPEHSTESDLLKTLVLMGHDPIPIQEDAHMAAPAVPEGTDLVLWLHTHGWDWDAFSEDDLLFDCKRRGIPTVGMTLDLFRGLKRHDPEYVKKYPWFKCKYFFSPDEPDYLKSLGVNAFFSPPAILETSCYLAEPDPDSIAYRRIVFVGSKNYHPEWPWREQLINFLQDEFKENFVLFEHSSGLRGHKLNVVYASAAVVVGDTCFASKGFRYTSDRLWETLGRGGKLVYPWVGGFEHGFHIYPYVPYDIDSLKTAIIQGMAEAPTRDLLMDAIGIIRQHHTYGNRLARIFTLVRHMEEEAIK